MSDDLNIWMKLVSWVSAAGGFVILVLGIVAFVRSRNVGWLLLSAWSVFSLLAGLIATYILPGQPGMVFACTGVVAEGLLLAGLCLLAFSKPK